MSPYKDLPSRNFWRTGVTERHPLAPGADFYRKKFSIRKDDPVATAGSCFAQHIARHMRDRGFRVLDLEPAPPGMKPETAQKFGFGLYSARYGNIYTARQMAQLAAEAVEGTVQENVVWEKDGRFYDALRPSVEPKGHASPYEVLAHRAYHLKRVRAVFKRAKLFVFTLGLTEAWVDVERGTVFPTAPGTIAGSFDPARFSFKNFSYPEVYEDLVKFRSLLKRGNSEAKILLTVSPVPLTATATSDHVLVATTYSKAVLRAVAGQFAAEYDDVDYFPSFEIIASHPSRGIFFESNLRSVAAEGVDVVMSTFFLQHPPPDRVEQEVRAVRDRPGPRQQQEDVICEEQLLDAFAA